MTAWNTCMLVTLGLMLAVSMKQTTSQACNMGYQRNNSQCVDVDECKDPVKHCGDNKDCINNIGGFNCMCKNGFQPSTRDNLRTDHCQDINECYKNKLICGPAEVGSCQNIVGLYWCHCNPGYSNHGFKQSSCSDINECYDSPSICGPSEFGSCQNVLGGFWCKCNPGYSNYGNNQTQCSELSCDQFKEESHHGQSPPGLAGLLTLLRGSCLGLSSTDLPGGGRPGEVLMENLFTAADAMLASGHLGNAGEASRLLGTMEDAVRFVVPQLKDDRGRMVTEHTEAEVELRRADAPPTGPILLTNQNAGLNTSWEVARNKTYQGFAFAALVTYKNLSQSLNNSDSFESVEDVHPEPDQNRRPSYQVMSRVVTVVVSNTDTKKLDQDVSITLRRLQEGEESETRKFACVFWEEGHGQEGAWSRRGCITAVSNTTHTVCTCSHLSSFAVLMALYPVEHTLELQLLTRLGLCVSVVCLALSIATFWWCRSIQGTRTTIHLHLCLCLFLADLVFLVGISRTEPAWGCAVVAGLLHFSFLGSFSWMLLEGVHLYRMLVLVFNATIRRRYLLAAGYGPPLLLVAVSAIARPAGYGTRQHCWLSLEYGLIWSFFGPVVTIIIINVFFFIITVWKLAQKFSSLNPDLTKLRKIRMFTVTAVAQLCVLGLMWVFGAFLFQDHGSLTLLYLFTILNSLQGALIFILHCLLSKQVREEYRNFLFCICRPKKKMYSDVSTSNPSSQSQGSKSQNTGESQI